MKRKDLFVEITVFLYVLLYIYTAASKWLNFDDFVWQMNNQPFDDKYTSLLVYGIPTLEILTSLLLLFKKTRLIGMYGVTSLMAVFTGYVALVTTNFYDRIPCSCGGIIHDLNWPQHLILNSSFLVIGIISIVILKKEEKPGALEIKRMAY